MAEGLSVNDLFSQAHYELRSVVPGMALGALDRKRMVEHVINDMVHQLLSCPGANPAGMTVTTNLIQVNNETCMEVVGTIPQYALSEDFFTH